MTKEQLPCTIISLLLYANHRIPLFPMHVLNSPSLPLQHKWDLVLFM